MELVLFTKCIVRRSRSSEYLRSQDFCAVLASRLGVDIRAPSLLAVAGNKGIRVLAEDRLYSLTRWRRKLVDTLNRWLDLTRPLRLEEGFKVIEHLRLWQCASLTGRWRCRAAVCCCWKQSQQQAQPSQVRGSSALEECDAGLACKLDIALLGDDALRYLHGR